MGLPYSINCSALTQHARGACVSSVAHILYIYPPWVLVISVYNQSFNSSYHHSTHRPFCYRIPCILDGTLTRPNTFATSARIFPPPYFLLITSPAVLNIRNFSISLITTTRIGHLVIYFRVPNFFHTHSYIKFIWIAQNVGFCLLDIVTQTAPRFTYSSCSFALYHHTNYHSFHLLFMPLCMISL